MRYRDWDYKKNEYAQMMCIVTEIDWSGALLLSWGDNERWAMADSVELINENR